jgi:hypothetical protein
MNAVAKQKLELPPARLLECTPAEYHRDPCETPSLSSSTAKVIVSESPLHAWTRHPRFGHVAPGAAANDDEDDASEEDDTEAKDNGSIIHNLILGKGADIVVIEADSFRTKVAKAMRAEARAAGQIPILVARFDALSQAAESLRRRLPSYGYELTGESEVAIEWYERGVYGPVRCRSMLDHVFINDGVIYDVKTIRSANPKHIGRTWIEKGYDLQAVCYPRALEALRPKLKGRIEMDFLFMEIKPPYAIVPCDPDAAILEVGRMRWGRAVQLWEDCLAKNAWPSYTNSRVTVEAPHWQITEYLGREGVLER